MDRILIASNEEVMVVEIVDEEPIIFLIGDGSPPVPMQWLGFSINGFFDDFTMIEE